ncbi:MAG TPA: sugar ABC transporter permease [Streptosporangiaceae bacterium]|nr:sugar ABC transporter permease [Streptosporangiaceae bacterium]
MTPYALILPAAAIYALFTVYPIFRQFDISFFNWHVFPGAENPFLGLENFTAAVHDPVVRTATFNTVLYVVITVPAQMLIGLFAAAILSDRLPAAGLWRALIFIPVVTSWVIVSYVFAYIFNDQGGVANGLLSLFAGHQVSIDWLAQTWTANAVIWIVGIWKGVGWSFVMFLAGLDGVPREIVEAGRVDGATELRLWRRIVIPAIRPTMVFVFVLLVIGGTQVFTQVYLMTGGGPYNSTQVLFTYAYQQAFTNFEFGYAAAIASMMAVIVFGLSVAEIQLLRRRNS